MTGRIKGDYWKAGENIIKLQIKTTEEQGKIEEILQGWKCVSYGYVPKTSEDIYVFEKFFNSENDWTDFLKSDTLNRQIEMKEVSND